MKSHSYVSSAHPISRWHTTTGAGVLAVALAARAVVNSLFAFWLWQIEPGWARFFNGGAAYLAIDGVIAVIASLVLETHVLAGAPRLLAPATAADGVVRIIAAIALHALPGLPDFPVTAVAFFGIVAGCALCLATVAITIRLSVWRSRHRAHAKASLAVHEEMDPIFIAGLVVLVLVAYAFIAGPPDSAADYRTLGIRWAFTVSISYAIAAAGVGASMHRADPS